APEAWDRACRRGIMPRMPLDPPPPFVRAGVPGASRLLRIAAILYGLLAAAALAWNGWEGRPWAYLDAASAAAGIDWPRDLALGLACAAAVIAASHQLTTRTRWGAALVRELAGASRSLIARARAPAFARLRLTAHPMVFARLRSLDARLRRASVVSSRGSASRRDDGAARNLRGRLSVGLLALDRGDRVD